MYGKKSINKRLCAILLCAVLLLTMLFSSVCIVRAKNHVCSGCCCLVCVIVARAERVLHGLALLLPGLLALFVLRLLWHMDVTRPARRAFARGTLVGWKIRLDD